MKLYVCWGTFQTPRPGGHPCHNAHEALRLAGHDPGVTKYTIGIMASAWITTVQKVTAMAMPRGNKIARWSGEGSITSRPARNRPILQFGTGKI